MLDVACGFRPSPAPPSCGGNSSVVASISAFYRKLARMELGIPEASSAAPPERARATHRRRRRPLARADPGVRARDPRRQRPGRRPSTASSRCAPTWSAGLPGMSLAVYEPASGLILDLILEENAHSQERALFDRIDGRARPALDHGPQLLRPLAVVPDRAGRRRSSWSAGIVRRCRSAPSARCGRGAAAPPADLRADDRGRGQ